MSDTELLLKSVTELSAMISSRDLSPVELAGATLRQIALTQPVLNAYLEPFNDELMASATTAETEISAADIEVRCTGYRSG